jgi:lipopolysaccharide/colanic/teichoic acid biosynthesis glycosyltransferase
MSELIALSGMEPSRRKPTRGANDGPSAAGTDVDSDNLPERVRALVGSGCVKELVLRDESRPEILAATVAAAREAGRGVKFVASSPLGELPPTLQGEKWLRVETTDEFTWSLIPRQRAIWKLAVKRLMDIVVSATLLVILAPVLLVIAVAVKLASAGPILYPWRVLGEHGRPFVGYKFRTMVREADALKPQLQHLNERSGPVFKMAKDPRVTPLGRWLRKHSLDELPQLWSVLIGDMSLVGPRPPGPDEYRNFELWQMRKLSVKPGITCLWQVDGRSTITDFSDWARLDLHYIDTWSLWQDIHILLRTPLVVFKGTGY